MKTTYATFDIADYLDNDEVITEYLSVAAEDTNPDVFIAALGVKIAVVSAKSRWKEAMLSNLRRSRIWKITGSMAAIFSSIAIS